jgi:hypothetical protein
LEGHGDKWPESTVVGLSQDNESAINSHMFTIHVCPFALGQHLRDVQMWCKLFSGASFCCPLGTPWPANLTTAGFNIDTSRHKSAWRPGGHSDMRLIGVLKLKLHGHKNAQVFNMAAALRSVGRVIVLSYTLVGFYPPVLCRVGNTALPTPRFLFTPALVNSR